MWGLSEADLFLSRDLDTAQISSEYGQTPWQTLKGLIAKYGVRNSEVTAIAPTANSSIRMAQNEMHEPFTRNMYVRQYIGGSIQVVNKYLVQELLELNLWNEGMLAKIVNADGSILNIEEIPDDIKERYRTVYEIDWRDLVDMMADRSAFVSQSGSFNHYTSYQEAGPTIFTQKILYAWRKGLKSLSYYMHTETATTAKKELAGLSETKSSQINDSIVDNLSSGPNPVSPLQMNITDKTAQNGVKILADGTICDRSNPDCEACSS
jgi:ribonucleoside-diphosphate reductase alpha chain